MTRRAFFAAFAAAIAGIGAPRALPAAAPLELELLVGDVITFGADPHEYVVTKVTRDTVQYSALDVAPPLFLHGAVFGHPFGARRVGRVTGTRAG